MKNNQYTVLFRKRNSDSLYHDHCESFEQAIEFIKHSDDLKYYNHRIVDNRTGLEIPYRFEVSFAHDDEQNTWCSKYFNLPEECNAYVQGIRQFTKTPCAIHDMLDSSTDPVHII